MKMPLNQLPITIKQISQHMKIIRFGFILPKEDPWKKITSMFKFGKKVDVEHLLKQKGFEDGQ